jgi:GNAT superfamily N-acetyltransferase
MTRSLAHRRRVPNAQLLTERAERSIQLRGRQRRRQTKQGEKEAHMTTQALASYPKTLVLQDKSEVVVRPMVSSDEEALLSFFVQLNEEDRHYLKDNVVARGVIAGWARDLDYDQVFPLLAVDHGRIVADATLHLHTGGARRHVAEVRVTVDPEYRSRSLGSALLRELLDYAYRIDLEEVTFELIADVQSDAIQAARRVGFVEAARYPGYVKGIDGRAHDLVILRVPLTKHAWW